MPAAPVLMDEPYRIEALQRLDILDSARDPEFDRLAKLAQTLARAQVGLVSMVDVDRQWFKAAAGLDATETSRECAFCAHAILTDDVTWVEDAAQDPRFSDNPLVLGAPHIRFYAGAPIILGGGERVATVCAFDPKPKRHDPAVATGLKYLAQIAAEAMIRRAAAR